MSNRFFDRLKAPEQKKPSQSDEIANGIVKAILMIGLILILIAIGMHYYF